MGHKYFTKGQTVQVSAHFCSTEFDCHGRGCCTQTIVDERLIEFLEKIREHFNAPITVTSSYRCPSHNSSVGGAQRSQHRAGNAADIVVKGVAPREVAKYAESIGVLGIGLYETSKDGFFVHIDTREYKAFWYGQAQKSRTTFGGTTTIIAPNVTGTNTQDAILNRGDSGQAVVELQEKLNKLGYSCGELGADGIFGRDTEDAVRRFQKATTGLAVDGIAGYQTLTAINKALSITSDTATVKSIKITARVLNVRSGAGLNHPVVANVRKGKICKLADEKDGWGKIQNPDGWISSQYYEYI